MRSSKRVFRYRYHHSHTAFMVLVLVLVAWTVFLLYFVSPEDLVSYIGVHNAYIFALLFAMVGGVTTITGYSFVATLLALAAGGANPLLLGLAGGLGAFVSDSFFFFVAQYGVKTFKKETGPLTKWLIRKSKSWPRWAVLSGIFVYVSATPLPNDPLLAALALMKYPYRSFAPVLFVGSVVLVTATAYFGSSLSGIFLQ